MDVTTVEILLDEARAFEYPLRVEISHEVFGIRAVYTNGVWTYSTSRRPNAFRSRWGSAKSFGGCFLDAIGEPREQFESRLSKEKGAYLFLVPTTDAQRVGSPRNPTAPVFFCADPELGNSFETREFGSFEDLADFMAGADSRQDVDVPIVGVSFMKEGHLYRIFTPEFLARRALRENEPNLRWKYLDLICSRAPGVDLLVQQHPTLLHLRDKLESLARFLHSEYMRRHVYRENPEYLPKSLHSFVRKCHSKYIETRKPIYLEDVFETLKENSSFLYLALTAWEPDDYREEERES
jgi:hypothetical protein